MDMGACKYEQNEEKMGKNVKKEISNPVERLTARYMSKKVFRF